MQDYKGWITLEKQKYIDQMGGKKQFLLRRIKLHPDYYAWKYIKSLRKAGYYYDRRKKNIFYMMIYLLACRRKNRLGRKLGIEMGEKCADLGLMIYHTQGIVVNGNARLGKNCRLHGNNTIGNNGKDNAVPRIGDNVDIGAGAKVIGDVQIAENVTIGAGAVVVDSCLEKGTILVGVPARPLKRK